MKTVNLTRKNATLRQVLDLAKKDPVLVKDKKGVAFVITSADEFETEVELLSRHHRLQAFLDKRFKSEKSVPLSDLEMEVKKNK